MTFNQPVFPQKKWISAINIFIIALPFIFAFNNLTFAQQTARSTPGGIGYLEYLPPGYASNPTNTYPVLIFLHGSGETGNGSASDLEKVKANGPPKLIQGGKNMCFTVNGVEECFIVISPQLNTSAGGWWPSILQPLFDHILNGSQNYRIDKTRVYLTGLSLGGQGVYIGLGETTDVFAAGAVIAGFSNTNGCTISARKIPVWGFHGEADGTIKYGDGLTEFSRIGWCTNPVPTAELKWTSYPGVGHNAWDKAYTTDHSVQSPLNVYEWLLTKRKNAPANSAPIANAGSDKAITLPTNVVSLTGTASDADGSITAYSWTKVSGGSASLTNANTPSVSLSGLVSGSYAFRLTVTDNVGSASSDDVAVTVNPAPNVMPTANAGADKIITLPANTLTLNGSATDTDGSITAYAWAKVSGGTVTLANANTATLGLSALLAGTYVFRLAATDNTGATATDDVTVTVNGSANVAPTANAGADKIIALPTNTLTLNGSATDTDGSITAYAWAKVNGGTVTLANATTATLGLSALLAGIYVFRLTATDNTGATATDDVTVTVNAAANAVPTANAGADKIITLPTNTLTLSGSATDTDGSITAYAWSSVSGGTVTLANATTATLGLSALLAGTYIFRLTATDNAGATATDDVTVTVNAAANIAPIAKAGMDQILTQPANSISFYGAASDADGTVTSYAWSKISGGVATLSSANTLTLGLSGVVAGSYTFRLTVTDNAGASSTDDVVLTVNPEPAGAPNLALLKTAVTSSNEGWANSGAQAVDGSSTTRWGSKFTDVEWIYVDLGSKININRVKITWQVASAADYKIQTSNDAVSWTDIKSITNNTSFTNDMTDLSGSGRYVRMYGTRRTSVYGYSIYEFEVYGNAGVAPVANAGADQTITLPTNTLILTGSGTDADGTIASYAWTKISGGTATLANANTKTLNLSGLETGSYVFRLVVTDNLGTTAQDDVVVTVAPASAPASVETNLAVLKSAVTSSDEGWANSGAQAIDNDATTRWGSKFTDAEWIYVDLGARTTVTRVKLTWQFASAASYKIQVSDDAVKWTDIKTITGNTAYTNDLTGLSGTGRYVRMFGITRNTVYGYSIYEFEVYGKASTTARTTTVAIVDETDSSVGQVLREEETSFFNKTISTTGDYSVIIFNSSGTKIYNGKWKQELYNELFAEKGFYYYHVLKLGKQVDSGKVFIKG